MSPFLLTPLTPIFELPEEKQHFVCALLLTAAELTLDQFLRPASHAKYNDFPPPPPATRTHTHTHTHTYIDANTLCMSIPRFGAHPLAKCTATYCCRDRQGRARVRPDGSVAPSLSLATRAVSVPSSALQTVADHARRVLLDATCPEVIAVPAFSFCDL